MKYRLDLSETLDVSSPPASGYAGPLPTPFYAWQPSTWPAAPRKVDQTFIETLKRIFEESILAEIKNVIDDAEKRNGNLEHRGHVVAIGLLCALDAISSYGYGAKSGKQIPDFVRTHFPGEYRQHAESLLRLYRHAMVHSWNLFKASIYPGRETIKRDGDSISFGLLHLFDALVQATEHFLNMLESDRLLRKRTLRRYRKLRESAEP